MAITLKELDRIAREAIQEEIGSLSKENIKTYYKELFEQKKE